MRVTLSVACLSLSAFIWSPSAGAGAEQAVATTAGAEQELKRLSVAWMQAWKERDRATLERLLAEDFVLVLSASTQRPVSRARWLEMALSGYTCESFEYMSQNVRLLGDTAIVASVYTQKASVAGQDRSGEFFLTDVWQQRGGRWQVVARYSSKPEGLSPSSSAVVPKEGAK
ncbi:MAG TPA: nuclear transport factor 2 family protein [Pyrinomonadaceae bacterium]